MTLENFAQVSLCFEKIPEPWKIQKPSCDLIHIHHYFESIFSRTACYIQIHTKCSFFRLERHIVAVSSLMTHQQDGATEQFLSLSPGWSKSNSSSKTRCWNRIPFYVSIYITTLSIYSRFNNSNYLISNIHRKIYKNDPSTKISISAALPFSSIVLILIWFAPQGVPHSDVVIIFSNSY